MSHLNSKPANKINELRFTPTRANSKGRMQDGGEDDEMKDATREEQRRRFNETKFL